MNQWKSGVYWGRRKYDAEYSVWLLVNSGDENLAGDIAATTTLELYGGDGPVGLLPGDFLELIRIPDPEVCRGLPRQVRPAE